VATKTILNKIARKSKLDPATYKEKLLFIKQFDTIKIAKNRVNFNRHEKTQLTKRFNKLKRFVSPRVKFQPLSTAQLAKLKNKNFNTTGKGIFIARPQDNKNVPIPGVLIRVNANGVVVTSKDARVDYTVPLSRADIIELIQDKPNLNNSVIQRIFRENRGLANAFRSARKKTIQILFTTHRSEQSFKDIGALNDYISSMTDAAQKAITGLVFTVFNKPKQKAKTKAKTKVKTKVKTRGKTNGKKTKTKRHNRR